MILANFHRPLPAVSALKAVGSLVELDLTFLLDRSGSMRLFQNTVRRAYNRTLTEQADVPGHVHFTPAFFGDVCMVGATESLGRSFFPLQYYEPRETSTRLLDGIADTITATCQRLKGANGRSVVVVIITDGRENASVRQTWDSTGAMIAERILAGWKFILLGANQDAQGTAVKLCIPLECAMTFAASSLGFSQAFRAVSANLLTYRSNPHPGGDGPELGFEPGQRAEQRRLLNERNLWTPQP